MSGNYSYVQKKLLGAVFLGLSTVLPFALHASEEDGGFDHTVNIYIWGAGLDGDTGGGAGSAPVDISFNDILDNMEGAFMGNYRAKRNQWAFNLDYIYLNLSPDSDKPPAEMNLKQHILELSAGYELAPGLDVIGGIRYVDLNIKTKFKGPLDKIPDFRISEDWLDPIIGLDYRTEFSEKWRFYSRGDVGGFGIGSGSELTWQLAAYIGYMPTKNWNLFAGYRHLDFDYESDDSNGFFYDIAVSGPLLGVGYHF